MEHGLQTTRFPSCACAFDTHWKLNVITKVSGEAREVSIRAHDVTRQKGKLLKITIRDDVITQWKLRRRKTENDTTSGHRKTNIYYNVGRINMMICPLRTSQESLCSMPKGAMTTIHRRRGTACDCALRVHRPSLHSTTACKRRHPSWTQGGHPTELTKRSQVWSIASRLNAFSIPAL